MQGIGNVVRLRLRTGLPFSRQHTPRSLTLLLRIISPANTDFGVKIQSKWLLNLDPSELAILELVFSSVSDYKPTTPPTPRINNGINIRLGLKPKA